MSESKENYYFKEDILNEVKEINKGIKTIKNILLVFFWLFIASAVTTLFVVLSNFIPIFGI